MNILLTNDDGFDAPGLVASYEALRELGQLHVVAPLEEQSGCSHRLTLRGPMAVHRRNHDLYGASFAVDGTPADCVRLAVTELIAEPIDLVVSGINRGANAGVDTYYSGTIAAAREGVIQQVRAISVSQAVRQEVELDWAAATRAARQLVPQLLAETLPGPGLWSINLPAPIPEPIDSHVHRVPVASSPIPVTFSCLGHEGSRVSVYEPGTYYWNRQVEGPSDYSVVRDGEIAITAIPVFGRF